MNEKYNIICLSNQLWDYPNWTNKRHVMYRMGQLGHRVVFVDPPINFGKVLLTHFKKGFFTLGRLLRGYKIADNVLIYTPIKFLPFKKFYSEYFAKQINNLTKSFFKDENKTILWIYNAEIEHLENYLDGVNRDYLLYDCVDYYAGFPRYQTKESKDAFLEVEKNLTQKADLVFATAPGLVERLKKYNSRTYYTPNVGDFELFHGIKEKYKKDIPLELKNIKHPIVGYIGALDTYKFDYEILKESATAYPDYSFVIIGDIALKDREGTLKELGLEQISNIHFLGSIPFVKTPKYMAHFDAELIPYVYNDYTVGGCFPVKFFNTMSAGIPSVVTDLPVFTLYRNITYISKGKTDFVENIKKALEEDSEQKYKERIAIASENTWDSKVSAMLHLIKSTFKS
jgi:glycosyltransferase involved in cell wall biosynthesis